MSACGQGASTISKPYNPFTAALVASAFATALVSIIVYVSSFTAALAALPFTAALAAIICSTMQTTTPEQPQVATAKNRGDFFSLLATTETKKEEGSFTAALAAVPAEDWCKTWTAERTIMLRMTSKRVKELVDKVRPPAVVRMRRLVDKDACLDVCILCMHTYTYTYACVHTCI